MNENDERADIDSETIIIDIDKCRKSDVRLEDIITDVEYLCLENDGQHVLTIPQNIKKADSLIYIIDDNEHLYCFNDKGKFVRDVAVQGKAKNEVMKLYDFEIDDKYVYLLDGMRSAILTFRHNGSFVSSKQLPFRVIRFKKQDETHWLFQLSPYTLDNKQECFQVATTDSKFKIISSKIAYNDGEIVSTRTPYFENRNNALFYAPLYRRGVYRLTDKYEWKLAYYFEFHTPYFETADMAEGQMKAAQDGGTTIIRIHCIPTGI
ncbi:BF3164 family lipoprotein [Prevotella sp.]|uniref:BF3164 family lipoprotein n=1 Tax=Prevotella sp. TaxID=59823 RepID=UPI0025F6CE97|nr:BF3164 family lipoprotein [Prevotella sp.]